MVEGHTVTVERVDVRVRAEHQGVIVAETIRPLLLRETGYPDRWYFPPEDVRVELLTPSDTHTFCPFKGTASYWSLPRPDNNDGPTTTDIPGGSDGSDQVWAYPDPLPAVAELKDHFCFYAAEPTDSRPAASSPTA